MRVAIIVSCALASCGEVPNVSDAGVEVHDAMVDSTPDTPTCTAGAAFCGTSDAVYLCNADGTDGTKVQDCEHGCADGTCHACAPGTTFCNGDDLSMCDTSGNIGGTTSCMAHGCQMDRCNTCTPGEQFCSADSAVVCNDDGTPGASTACGANGCTGGVCNACTPSTTACQGDTLVVCNAGGTVTSATSCALGCSSAGSPHCRSLVPSYSVGVPTGVDGLDLDINTTATIDISSCTRVPNTVTLTIGSTTTSLVGSPHVAVVTQAGAPPICVVKYHNITLGPRKQLTIQNSSSMGEVLALAAGGVINIQGAIVFRNSANGSAPGIGATTPARNRVHIAAGPGGGGNGLAGGKGGACVAPACGSRDVAGGSGGVALSSSRLFAGSKGGDILTSETSVRLGIGGPGGGGLHLIALQSITIGTTGRIDINGLGGRGDERDLPAGGGGAGGTLVVETPALTISQGAILAANGGGGAGGCYTCTMLGQLTLCRHANAQPGQLSVNRASGGACASGGNGGFGANGVTNPSPNGQRSTAETAAGGGGGGNGVILLRARDTAHRQIASGSVISPAPVLGNVKVN